MDVIEAHAQPRGGRGLLSSTDVGSTNRARLLQALADQGPLSRADLARLIRVPRATVGTIVSGLLTAGVLEEDEPQAPVDGIGKPSRPLWFGRDAALCGAITIDAGSVEVAVVDARGEVRSRGTEPLPAGASSAKVERLVDTELLSSAEGDLMITGKHVPESYKAQSRYGIQRLCTPGQVPHSACTLQL